jgi:lipopolysaccharide assembly outer membrane protein LptD (OstA)
VFATVAIAVCAHASLAAQVPGGAAARRDTVRARGDTTHRDSTAADSARLKELIKWNEPDSLMQVLMKRPGYTATRYQGDVAVFNAQTHALELTGKKAGVNRDQTVLVGDTIVYNDSTKIVVARGDTLILRDPQQQAADVVARHRMAYNIERHRGVVENISTQIAETGQQWLVNGKIATFISDTTRGRETAFYVRAGTITSCDDSIPDYHFRSNEIKMISKNIMVARPAILYIGDVPIMWLPFIFQDIRSGRRSGVITPRFGVNELLRSSPTYRRHVENLGYYFAISDYMDAQVALDWRSGARSTVGDPGWVKINGEMQYRWLDRFMTGQLAMFRHSLNDGTTNTGLSWGHSQDFSQNTHLRADINYVTNTFVQRTTTFNPAAVLANIASNASYTTKIGPAAFSLGATRTQHPGRTQVEQGFPSLSITVPTISPASWLDWSPGFSLNTSQNLNMDTPGEFPYRYFTGANGQQDSVRRIRNQRTTGSRFDTPIRIGGFTWSNSFSLNDQEDDQPQTVKVRDVKDSSVTVPTVFAKTYRTDLDWSTGISLPGFLQSSLKLAPSVSFGNVDPSSYWVRSELNGGKLVHQSKRAMFGLGASPTLFALFPGFGPVTRFRHSITPVITYTYAPTGTISDEFLRAQNRTRQGYLGAIAQNRVSLGLSHVLEAKMKSTDTSSTAEPRKIKVLSMNLTGPLAYDFERARVTHRSGFATDNIGSDISTDLLPGFHGGFDYSLYQGDILSDTARFKPFRTRINAGLSLNSQSGIFGAIGKLFGRGAPQANPQTGPGGSPGDALARGAASAPVAGISSRNRQFEIPDTQGWSAQLQYSWNRQRPPVGHAIIIDNDPKAKCAPFIANPIVYEQCVQLASANPDAGVPFQSATSGGAFIRTPPQSNLDGSVNFHLTPMWAGTWRTNYDFQAHKFGSQFVTLQRQLHDWRAIFSFSQAPNGNFQFTFFIALIAEPDLKFNYDKSTYRPVAP